MEPTHLGLDDELINLVKGIMEEGLEESISIEDYSLEEIQDYMVSEDFEQLDELSKKTLGAYATKAAHQFADNKTQAQQEYDRGVSMQLHGLGNDKMRDDFAKKNFANSKGYMDKSIKRRRGLEKAIGKLTKESVELVENDLHTLFKHEKAAGYHPSTGESHYARKVGNKIHVAAHDDDNGHYTATFHINSKGGGDYEGNPNSEHKSKAEAIAAVNKRAGVKEEVEPIDELSKGTLSSYVNKAAQSARIHGIMQGDFNSKSKNARKPGTKQSWSKMKSDAQNTGWKRQDGIKTAVSKLAKEEVEEIDELSKGTLGSYVNKASKDTMMKGRDALGHDRDAKETEYKARIHQAVNGGSDSDAIRSANDSRDKSFDSGLKARSRLAGISKAVGKLTKEEVEPIDELSKGTLGSYVKKAAVDAANSADVGGQRIGSGASGSWDSYKKAIRRHKNINKAVDKLTKEEVEEIDEVSKELLGRYITKSSLKAAGHAYKASDDKSGKHIDKTFKRLDGIKVAAKKLTKEEVEEIEALAAKHGLSEAVIEESAELSRGAKNALAQAASHKSGSEEYHKWMAVHHSHAARSGKLADQAHHSIEAEHHFNNVAADNKAGEDFHNGDSHHWNA